MSAAYARPVADISGTGDRMDGQNGLLSNTLTMTGGHVASLVKFNPVV